MYDDPDLACEDVVRLAEMVAASESFQQAVAKTTAEDAKSRIHGLYVPHFDHTPRPFALIQVGEVAFRRVAGGARNVYAMDAAELQLCLAGELDNPQDSIGSLLRFSRWARQVIEDVLAQSPVDDKLNITEAVQISPDKISHEAGGDIVPYCWSMWALSLAQY